MNSIYKFLKDNKYAIVWTISYITIVWAVLMFMFNFNMFSWAAWQMLMHARIRGFAGFVFCIFILAALPLYVATTTLIIRTKKPLFTVSVPKIFKLLIPNPTPINPPAPDPEPEPTETTEQPTPVTTPENNFPENMPSELRNAAMELHQKIATHPTPVNATQSTAAITQTPPQPTQPVPELVPVAQPSAQPEISDIGNMPLPQDFDFDTNDDWDDDSDIAAPVFTDVFFDDDKPDPTPQNNESISDNPVTEYLIKHNRPHSTQDNLITSHNLIIATHNDPDFWIADPDFWFAAGQQKPSPVLELIRASAKTKTKPILYLGQTNILDLENHISEWQQMGITVITNLDDLPAQ